MSTQVQYRRGSNVQVAAFTGALGELVIDTTNKLVVVNDGVTAGGFPQVGLTATQTLTNKIYQGTSLSVSGNVTGGNITTGGVISATGNIIGGNILGTIVGTISTTSASVSGNITGGNLLTGGIVSATGNVTGNYLLGNAYFVTGLSPTQIYSGTSNVTVTGSGANISVGVGGTPNVVVFATTGTYTTGLSSVTGNITGGNISATNHTGTTVSVTGTVTAASTVGGVITGSTASLSGTVTGGNVATGGNVSAGGNILASGYLSVAGNLYVANIISQQQLTVDDPLVYFSANVTYPYNYTIGFYSPFTGGAGNTYQHTGVMRDYADNTWKIVSNIPEPTGTTVNFTNAIYDAVKMGALTATSTSVTGTTTAASVVGGVITGSSLSVTGTTTAASVVGGVITGSSASVTGAVTGASAAFSGASTAASYSATGTITGASVVGGVMSGTSLTVTTGTITGGNIVNGNGNGVGNIGSSTTYFNTVFAKATSAQYADLAEMYCADAEYAPGTVVEFGGSEEITITTESHSTRTAGIISTNPSYLMNSTLTCTNALEVALVGRVPCQVTGTIKKGDRLVSSSIPGVATCLDMAQYQPGCIIGKALEDYNSETVGTIEVAVGRI